jgi:ribonucleotide monophosphatase NagD (HAD superfamily)
MKNALFFDIDGTLVDDRNVIPKSALQGIKEARRKSPPRIVMVHPANKSLIFLIIVNLH